MKKFLTIIIILITVQTITFCQESVLLQTGISMTDQVPTQFFGTWKITSTINNTSNRKIFNEKTTDIWNLAKVNDVIILTNPISGAQTTLTIQDVKNYQIKFTHTSQNKIGKMTETPNLILDGENFYGTDKIVLEKFKNGEKISEDYVVYNITAQKISGMDIKSFFSTQ